MMIDEMVMKGLIRYAVGYQSTPSIGIMPCSEKKWF